MYCTLSSIVLILVWPLSQTLLLWPILSEVLFEPPKSLYRWYRYLTHCLVQYLIDCSHKIARLGWYCGLRYYSMQCQRCTQNSFGVHSIEHMGMKIFFFFFIDMIYFFHLMYSRYVCLPQFYCWYFLNVL